jgi:hypothetical protein
MLLLTLVTFGCTPTPSVASPVTADRATAIARDFAVSGQPSGTQVFDLVVGTPEQVDRAWRVQVDFTVLYPLHTSGQRGPIHLLIDVDRNTGEPVIVAQG